MENIYVNKFGIRNKKCCASCMYYEDGKCIVNDTKPKNFQICDRWKIRPSLISEGRSIGRGKIRSKEFIEHLCVRLMEPDVPGSPKPTRETIEKEWYTRNGSPYIEL